MWNNPACATSEFGLACSLFEDLWGTDELVHSWRVRRLDSGQRYAEILVRVHGGGERLRPQAPSLRKHDSRHLSAAAC